LITRITPARLGQLLVGLSLYVGVCDVWLWFELGGPRVVKYLGLLAGTPPALAALYAVTAAAWGRSEGAQGRGWRLLSAALALYFIGDQIGACSWLFGRDPFPGPADVFFCLFYAVLCAACVGMIRATAVRVRWLQLLLDALIFALGFGALFWFLVIRPTAAVNLVHSIGPFLTQLYLGLDCTLLLLLGVVVLSRRNASPWSRRASLFLLLGFATMFLADIVWSLAKVRGVYLPGQFQDVLYITFNIPIAAAAYAQMRAIGSSPQAASESSDVLAGMLPHAAMFAAFLVLVYSSPASVFGATSVTTMILFALMLLLMVRQTVALRSDALVREQNAARRVEERYASLIANASDAIMIVDAAGVFRFVSPASQRLLGLSPAQMASRPLGEVCSGEIGLKLQSLLHQLEAAPGATVGPVEIAFERDGRRWVFECVGNNLLQDPAVQGYALNLRDISERKRLEEQLRHLAFHDPLTRLANRSLFRDRVQHALAIAERTAHSIAVMFLDLDRFKNVNDTLGHDAGDRLLQSAAQRLVGATRTSDTVARLGGDEFAVLVEGCSSVAEVEDLADKLIETLRVPFTLNGQDVRVGVSIGIAWCGHEAQAETLLSNADVAMYHAKASGKNRHVTFRSQMQDALRERLRLETDIERALANEEFFLEYQPIVDLGSRSLLGVEALVRWRHPEAGLLMPARFIQVIEESGKIIELGKWVLVRACRDLCTWRDCVAGGTELRLAVNISGRHLQHGDIVADVAQALALTGFEATNLVIELTESTITQATDANLERFRRLKALGVRVAIDDFGVGYSSLSYLHSFPIDILKIDRAFVAQLRDFDRGSDLARAVIALGETLGLDTLAEGIEHESQVGVLQNLGCVAGQGFLFQAADSLERLSGSSFVARRKELWAARAQRAALSPTGRFNALKVGAG
jgi:diguanylate cyclase (GGDEF)-like protein/PAS domain S-box-containing protein